MLRGAERIWPPSAARRSAAVPNGEGVASGSATLFQCIFNLLNIIKMVLFITQNLIVLMSFASNQ